MNIKYFEGDVFMKKFLSILLIFLLFFSLINFLPVSQFITPKTAASTPSVTDTKLHPTDCMLAPVKNWPQVNVQKLKKDLVSKGITVLPTSVDWSSKMPPVGDKGGQGSCVAWATAYYYKTFQEGKDQNWDLSSIDHQFSPAFVYNQINSGRDGGCEIPDALQLLVNKGCDTLAVFPYNENDYLTQPTSQQLQLALPFKAQGYANIFQGQGNCTDDIINTLKSWLANGDSFVIAIPVYPEFDASNDPSYVVPPHNPNDDPSGSHAVLVVGYNDNLYYIDNSGTKHYGAFKIVNSWGTGYGYGGYANLSYDFFKVGVSEAWTMTDAFTPKDFTIGLNPIKQSVELGKTLSYTVMLSSLSGFNADVSLSVSGLSSGITYSLSSNSVTPPQNVALTLSIGSSFPLGTCSFTVSGTSGSIMHEIRGIIDVKEGVSFYGTIEEGKVVLNWDKEIKKITEREYGEKLTVTDVDVEGKNSFSETAKEDLITEFFDGEIYISFIYSQNNKNVVAIIVLNEDFEELRPWLFSWMKDIFKEGYNVILQSISDNTSPQSIRNYLKIVKDLKGVELVGDIPAVWIKIVNPWEKYRYKELPTNVFYQDLDSEWIDKDNDGIYDGVKGDPLPEIWCGTLKTGFDKERNIDALKRYFERIHLYRDGILVVPDRGLVYFDRSTSAPDCGFSRFFNKVELVADPQTTKEDYLNRLKEKNYGLVYAWSHGTPTSQMMMTVDEKTSQGDVTSQDIKEINPGALFINLEACLTARFTTKDFLDGSYTFSKYPLLTIGWTIERGGPWDPKGNFFNLIFSQYPFSKIQLDLLKNYKHINDYPNNFYGYTYIGDPLLYLKRPSLDADGDFISDLWEKDNGFNPYKVDSNDNGISDFDEIVDGKGKALDNILKYIFDIPKSDKIKLSLDNISLNVDSSKDYTIQEISIVLSLIRKIDIKYDFNYPWVHVLSDPQDSQYTDLKDVYARLIGNRFLEFKVTTYRMGDPEKDFHINIVIDSDGEFDGDIKGAGYILRGGNLGEGHFGTELLEVREDGSIRILENGFYAEFNKESGEYYVRIRLDYLNVKGRKIGISVGINSWVNGKPNWDWALMAPFNFPRDILTIEPAKIETMYSTTIKLTFDNKDILEYLKDKEVIEGKIIFEKNENLLKELPFNISLKDINPPELTIVYPQNGFATNNERILIKGTVSDKESGLDKLLINGEIVNILEDGTFEKEIILQEGENKIVVEAYDKVGNRSEEKLTVRYVKRIILKFQIGNKVMYVNDNPVEIDVPPIIIEGRTYLPIRWVAEPIEANVDWSSQERKVTVSLKDKTIELWIGKYMAKVNSVDTPIDSENKKVVPMIVNGRTMLPLRFIAENLGCDVQWDGITKTITITYQQ